MSRYSLTIDHTKVPSTQTNFPVYVNLNDVISGMTTAQANSIRVYKADGVTEVAREIVSSSEMHFKADSVSSSADTVFVIDIDGVRSDYSASDTYGAQNVWTNGYGGVWHSNQVNANDSTSYGSNGTATGAGVSLVDSKIGKGLNYNGTASVHVGVQNNVQPSSAYTISAWAKLTGNVTTTAAIFRSPMASWNSGMIFVPMVGNKLRVYNRYPAGAWTYLESTNAMTVDTMYFVQGVWTGSELQLFRDGVKQSTTQPCPSIYYNPAPNEEAAIGQYNTNYFKGEVDEVRLSSVARSADWIATEYANQNSPSTFYGLSEIRHSVQGIASIQGVTSIVL